MQNTFNFALYIPVIVHSDKALPFVKCSFSVINANQQYESWGLNILKGKKEIFSGYWDKKDHKGMLDLHAAEELSVFLSGGSSTRERVQET